MYKKRKENKKIKKMQIKQNKVYIKEWFNKIYDDIINDDEFWVKKINKIEKMLARGKVNSNIVLLIYNKNGNYEYPLPRNMKFNDFSYCLWKYYFYGLGKRIHNHEKLQNCYLLLLREDNVISLQLVLSKIVYSFFKKEDNSCIIL